MIEWAESNLRANGLPCDDMEHSMSILEVLVATGRAVPYQEYSPGEYTKEEFEAIMMMDGAKRIEED